MYLKNGEVGFDHLHEKIKKYRDFKNLYLTVIFTDLDAAL